jgi:hypothetical protein
VPMMEIAGESADGKHQGRCNKNEIVPIHPGSEPMRRFVRRKLKANGLRENERKILP